jgi:zinc protease
MINFEKFTLPNGLRVIVHADDTTTTVAISILYDVGARDESPEQTGFAHLFEHLMFGGSINIPEYDEPLQIAGGENNAYTTNDLTNYYLSLPKENMETAFWLESDRMLSLAFSAKSLDVQRKVVCEEFKEHYINKPYGDVWEIMRKLCYTTHPYQWQTIGKELKHIEEAQLQDVKNFFAKHYNPSNAILTVAGNITVAEVKAMAEKWFGPIPAGNKYTRNLPVEPKQTQARKQVVYKDVPVSIIYKAYHGVGRTHSQYHAMDLLTEVLGNGKSCRLYTNLVKEQKLFTTIDCYHFGSSDPGLVVVSGKLADGVDAQVADEAITKLLANFCEEGITDKELQKTRNTTESLLAFEDMSVLNRANNLSYYELLGNANLMNDELDKYNAVSIQDIKAMANTIFDNTNCNTLWYLAQKEEDVKVAS